MYLVRDYGTDAVIVSAVTYYWYKNYRHLGTCRQGVNMLMLTLVLIYICNEVPRRQL